MSPEEAFERGAQAAGDTVALCSSCGFSLQRPDDWTGEYWATIRDNRGVHHYWCWGRGDLLEGIERTAQAAWEAGL